MRLELTGRHIDITPILRHLVDTKLARLDRLLNDSAVSAQAVLARERGRHRTEITVHTRGEKFLHAVGSAPTWETSLGQAVDKIAQQAQRVKGKWQGRKRRGRRLIGGPAGGTPVPETGPRSAGAAGPRVRLRRPRTLKASRQAVKPMTIGDALRDLEADADGIVVFCDVETDRISVLYRHRDGELRLVETET